MSTSLIGIVLIVLGIVTFIAGFIAPRKQDNSKKNFARYPVNIREFKSRRHTDRKVIKFKYILGFTLLLLALIYESSPSLRIEIGFRLGLQERPQSSSLASDWPWKENNQLHPVILNMPPDAETSIKSVADYIKAKVTDPYEQTKALHDYVATRISYDTKAFQSKRKPRQDAAYVFRKQKAICTGYANLLVALGKEIDGINIVKVTGDIREELAEEEGIQTFRAKTTGHVWNAIKIADNWHLIDVTWDSSRNTYKNDYLMIPPEVMLTTHFPDHPSYQLLDSPLSKAEFENQPLMEPNFFANKLKLIFPTNYQNVVQKLANIKIDNPQNIWLIAGFAKDKQGLVSSLLKNQETNIQKCDLNQGTTSEISCNFPTPGEYKVILYSKQKDQTYNYLGQLKFKYRSS